MTERVRPSDRLDQIAFDASELACIASLVQRGAVHEAATKLSSLAAHRCGRAVRLLVRDAEGWHVEIEVEADGAVRTRDAMAPPTLALPATAGATACQVSVGDHPIAILCVVGAMEETGRGLLGDDLQAPLMMVGLALAHGALTRAIERRDDERRAAEAEALRIQSALRESESRFRRMAETTQDVIWITELEPERVIYVSPSFERLWGHSAEALYADPHLWVKGIHPDDRANVGASFSAWIADTSERPWVGEFRVVHPSGAERWMLDRGAKSPAGEKMRVSGISTDITERRLAEQALAASQERFALAMEAARDGHWDWVLETDEFYASDRMLEIYGFPTGHRFNGREDFLRQFPFLPGERERWNDEFGAYLRGDKTHFELTIGLLRDGQICYARLHGLLSRDPRGRSARWTGSVRDVTEQRAREVELRLSEERFALAVAASNDGIWDWDAAGDEAFLSERAQSLFGLLSPQPTRSRSQWLAAIRWHPADAEDHQRRIDGYLAGREPAYDGEWRVRQSDGEYRWIRIRGQCVRDATGRPLRMAGSVSDIDVSKRTEAALRQAQRLEAVGTLAGGIAHDFNNILGAILGLAELGSADTRAGSRARRDIDLIAKAAGRGRALVERLLAFGRAGTSERVPVQIAAVVEEGLQLLESTLPADVVVEATIGASQATALCDPTQLHQVVMNLLTNAVQAMPLGGRLRVSTHAWHVDDVLIATIGNLPRGDYVVLDVEDTGEGIQPEVLPRIFDPFFSTKDVGMGAGLGLSLVQGIVSEHHGAVVVDTRPGAGSRFRVYFPRGAEHPALAISQPSRKSGRAASRVLVVDDDDLVLQVMVDALARAGFEPSGFALAPQALAAFVAQGDAFDAVVTDGRMPGMTGQTLIAALRAQRPSVPIVLVTGYLDTSNAEAASAAGAGADVILHKPVSLKKLVAVVARLTAATGALSERINR